MERNQFRIITWKIINAHRPGAGGRRAMTAFGGLPATLLLPDNLPWIRDRICPAVQHAGIG